ncbi:hypothetical protein PTI98_013285 [Pleurotus ostreatus]|nr:hypothetical protein PTI98_013285 [Pleurotus ostreatus]
MSFLKDLVAKLPDGFERARAQAIGIINPNRRHDDPEEKAQDAVRAEIMAEHRFNSFAHKRSDNTAKWHVDGHDYMWAVSEMIDSARDVIFIMDWWLTPELYLRRPPAYYPEWRLDRLLKRKAEQGVKIYVIVYKEVTQTMSMSSKHTKRVLSSLHPNVLCIRHPDHIGSKDNVQFWSHHEKVVAVDNHYVAIGGLDLCFGRWDTSNHPLADVHPADFSRTLFPGQDYNNARIQDFQNVYEYASNTLSILESARMPWHDVHMTMTGPAVLDVVQHFVERWNEIKKRKYRNDSRYDWLALPHNVETAPHEPVARHPHREQWHEMGRRFKNRWHRSGGEDDANEADEDDKQQYQHPGSTNCNIQVVRSVSDWSHGVLNETSIQNAYIQLIDEAEHFIYIENQFFITATKTGCGPIVNQIGAALVRRIKRAFQEGARFKVIVCIPEVPGFAGDIKTEGSLKIIMAAQYRSINRGGSSIYEELRDAGIEPLDYIRFYHLRSYDRINAPYESYISQIERNSGVRFLEAQVALAREWIGNEFDENVQTEAKFQIPEPNKEGVVLSEKTPAKIESIRIPPTEEEARQIVKRFEHGADTLRGDEDVADSVAQHMLHDRTSLLEEKWLGSEEEELQAYVSELLYIHSKLMIVDDRRVIMGSANINDRSQKGDGDSEIAVVIEDNDEIDTTMNGRPYKAARFASTLRRQLFREHLGLIKPQECGDRQTTVTRQMRPAPIPIDYDFDSQDDIAVADPLSDNTDILWNTTARKNREIFTEIFRPVPSNLVRSWKAYENYLPKVKTGHVVPGIPLERVKARLNEVRGALVECPLDFLIDEKEFIQGPEWTGINPTLPIYI